MKSRPGPRDLLHVLIAAAALSACLGCAGSPDDPERDSYPIESRGDVMMEEEREEEWRDVNR